MVHSKIKGTKKRPKYPSMVTYVGSILVGTRIHMYRSHTPPIFWSFQNERTHARRENSGWRSIIIVLLLLLNKWLVQLLLPSKCCSICAYVCLLYHLQSSTLPHLVPCLHTDSDITNIQTWEMRYPGGANTCVVPYFCLLESLSSKYAFECMIVFTDIDVRRDMPSMILLAGDKFWSFNAHVPFADSVLSFAESVHPISIKYYRHIHNMHMKAMTPLGHQCCQSCYTSSGRLTVGWNWWPILLTNMMICWCGHTCVLQSFWM